ncbi:MAG TPA: hypothetical protein DHU81_19110, partial [Hyphomonas sp.]|nr:hypothetical protein [Hyphomonas sp.]
MLQNARTLEEAVVMEQMRATSRNLSALYAMLCVASLSLGMSFLNHAPLYLTLGLPCLFIVGSILRINHWRDSQAEFTDPLRAQRDFVVIEIGSLIIFAVIGGWIALLWPYAIGRQEAQLALFTGLIG